MNELYRIDVRVQDEPLDDDLDHIEISLWWAGVYADDATDDEESYVAGLHVAGLLARLACEAAPWVALEHQEHGCPLARYGVAHGVIGTDDRPRCGLYTSGLLDVAEPLVALVIPSDHVDTWLTRVRGWLEQLDKLEHCSTWEQSRS